MKRTIVTLGAINALGPVEKVAKIRDIKSTCESCDDYKASAPCQASMGEWSGKADALEKIYNARKLKEAELALLVDEEMKASLDCDAAGNVFGANVQSVAKSDPNVATRMGLPLRSDPEFAPEIGEVTGVQIGYYKKTGAPRLSWDESPGAVLYRAEMSQEPATDGSWSLLEGRGKSRKIPLLVRGQRYAFRVCALGTDGKASPWSATVTFVAP